MLGLSSIDIGRPLSTVKLDLHDLEEKALDVIRDVLRQQDAAAGREREQAPDADHSLPERKKAWCSPYPRAKPDKYLPPSEMAVYLMLDNSFFRYCSHCFH